ncbi:MAG TPA: hypothetical protein VGO86_11455, partial [Candidatus Dormibacteraeota bacterium]
MVVWRALLLVYGSIALPGDFTHRLEAGEIAAGLDSFVRFPELAAELSEGEVAVTFEVARPVRPLDSLTAMDEGMRWPSPDDTRPELTRLARPGSWDSIFVLWPQGNLATGAHVATGG